MGFKGSVESFSLADVFQNLAMNQQTGTLRVFGNGSDEKNVFFQNGQVRHLSRGSKATLLPADVFIARGLVARGQVDAAVERQRETGQSLGNCLIDLGQINEEQLDDVTRHQIEEEIYDLFGWDHASFEFSDGQPSNLTATGQFPQTGPALPISHLIMEAARRVDEWERLRKLIPSPKEIYAMELSVRKAVEKGEMEMEPVEKRVATLINGARDVEDLIADSGLFKFEVYSTLGGFITSSLVRGAKLEELRFAEEDCARQNLPKRRMKVLERILAVGGENPKVRKDLADLLAKENDIEKACIHYSVLADAELKADREDAAIEMYKKILAISPKHVKSHEQLAAIHSKHGKKREAFIHYQELFETFREQNHMKEARVAGACALECDPTHGDLRNSLIELLLADNQKEAAGQQLELLGDQAAKAGNVKLASDSYRRAMQCRPGNKQLKKKLADVMLTKEDRRARKQRAVLALVVIVLLGTAGGGLTLLETTNSSKFNNIQSQANALVAQAVALEKEKKYPEAQKLYQDAAALYAPLKTMTSPFLKLEQAAGKLGGDLRKRADSAADEQTKQQMLGERLAKADLDSANLALSAGSMFEARDQFKKVIENKFAVEDVLADAKKGLDAAQVLISEFETGKARMKRPDQIAEFGSIEAEIGFKRTFYQKFSRFLNIDDVQLPLLVLPNQDKINVFRDDALVGTVNQDAPKDQNTFRAPWGSHRYKFTKEGFATVDIATGDLASPKYTLVMERVPKFNLNLLNMDPDIQLSGEAVLNGETVYIGTTNGSLLQVDLATSNILRRFDPPVSPNLNRDVYGQIFVYPRSGKPDLIAYATRDGECYGVELGDPPKFNLVWGPVKTNILLAAPPTVFKIQLMTDHPIMLLPFGKDVHLVDCENGKRPGEKAVGKLEMQLPGNATISSSAIAIDNNQTIVMGCSDGNMYGFDLKGDKPLKVWSTDVKGALLKGRPTVVGNRIYVGCGDGKIYIFDTNKPGSRFDVIDLTDPDGGAGSIDADPLIVKNKLYVGANLRDAFYGVDLTNKRFWRVAVNNVGLITKGAAIMGHLVFFGTESGKLYCVDADKGFLRWVYAFKPGTHFSSAPIVVGNRVYCFTTNGLILGFDEPQSDR